MMDELIQRIGSYEILGVLESGTQTIYQARGADGRAVALKTLRVADASSELRQRFEREAEICAYLDCPNLVGVYDSGEADGILYQARELLEGKTLATALAEGHIFAWDEKLRIMDHICGGLSYIHAQQIVHRDLKPDNVFLETSGGVRVIGFGLAHVEASKLTRAGMAAGTLSYMAPEQVQGATCTPATDVFVAGIVFFELATGRHPFAAPRANMVDVIMAITSKPMPDLRQLVPDAPEALELVIGRALEKDPARRFHDAAELRDALKKRAEAAVLIAQFAQRAAPAPRVAGEPEANSDAKGTVVMKRIPTPIARPTPPVPVPAPSAAPPPTKSAPLPDAVYCPACTCENLANATVCSGCGRPLKDPAIEPQMVESESKPKLPLLLLGALCLLVIVAVLFEVLFKK